MARAIRLAKNGLGTTYPNPMVGCVIVKNEKIIGEGYTSPYGGAHAEINAIALVKDKSELKSATLFVTLEPCSHQGKTPPCVDAILKHNITKIVIGLQDPNPLVAGAGIKKLRQAGCEVITDVMEKECREHHKRFLSFQENKRPYVILKWAETIDGFIAPTDKMRSATPNAFWITNSNSKQLVHQWRAEEQAILVGTNTVLADNPRLNVREFTGKNPLRVILDRQLKIPSDYHVLDKSTATLVLTSIANTTKYLEGVTYEVLDFSSDIVPQILKTLYQYKINSVLVEGGTKTLQSFINADLWDEARVFTGNKTFKKGIRTPIITGTLVSQMKIKTDTLITYRNA